MNLKQMAGILNVAESTLRFWRDRYQEFIPCTGTGRRRRYPKEALEVFQFIRDTGGNSDDVREALSLQFPYELEGERNKTTTRQHQQSGNNAANLPAVHDEILPAVIQSIINENLTRTLEIVADQKERLERLEADRERLDNLERNNRFLQNKIDSLTQQEPTRAGVDDTNLEEMRHYIEMAKLEIQRIDLALDKITLCLTIN